MNILFGVCLLLGLLCLLYYGIITVYAGLGTAFAWFWICAGLGFLILSFIIRYMIKNEIKLPSFWRYILITVFSAGLCLFIIIEGTIIYYSSREAKPDADYLIVLGAQVRGMTITKSLKKRLDTAAGYLEDSPKTIVIVSGGQGPGEDVPEAEAMKRYLITKGIDETRIIMEDQSTNTEENIRFSRKLMKGDNPTAVVVTNGFHIFRSLSIAKKQGLSGAQGLAAPSDKILVINYYIREAAGVLKDFLFGNI
jgi:uncharacterized SAM-binding protein YcdF (DUF218 family)